MTISQSATAAATFPDLGLPDVVTEILCEVAEREGREFIVMWLPGECATQKGESILSTMIDSPCASISFVHDCCGATWLTWQVHSETIAGARCIVASDDVEKIAEFCCGLLMLTHNGFRGTSALH